MFRALAGALGLAVVIATATACDAGGSGVDSGTDSSLGLDAGPNQCGQDRDCNDGIACTIDDCTDGACAHTACVDCCPDDLVCVIGRGCGEVSMACTEHADCADDTRCTLDRCGDLGFCEYSPQDDLCPGGEICIAGPGCIPAPPDICSHDSDCSAPHPCSATWRCEVEFGCQYVSEISCDDGDACSVDGCDEEAGGCVHLGSPERCNGSDDDCDGASDEDWAELDTPCVVGIGGCARTGVFVCDPAEMSAVCGESAGTPSVELCTAGLDEDCDGDLDCADGDCASDVACDPCGVVSCGECETCDAGACEALPGTPSCTDDGDSCTEDLCLAGTCRHPAIACTAPLVCSAGTCIDACASVLCSACQRCDAGACLPQADGTPCAGGACWAGACCADCWDGSSCEPGGAVRACGTDGVACADCSDGLECTDDACVAGACSNLPDDTNSCAGGVCRAGRCDPGWSVAFGSTGADAGWAITTDAAGNIYVTGYFEGSVDFGGGPLTSGATADLFVLSLDSSGVHRWSSRFGGPALVDGVGIAVDGSGRVFVTGRFQNTVNFGGGPLVSAGASDMFVLALDASGAHRWSRRYGGPSGDISRSIATHGGNVYVTGVFYGTVDFGGGPLTDAGMGDAFVLSLDSSGVHRWSQRYGSGQLDWCLDVAVDPAGNLYLTGVYGGTVGFGGAPVTSVGGSDIFAVSLTSAGAHRWTRSFGGSTEEAGYSIATDATGATYITGMFESTINFGGASISQNGGGDIFVLALDPSGAHRWSRGYGGTALDAGFGIAVDESDGVYVSGGFSSTIDLGGGPLTSAGVQDIFVMGLSRATGAHRWSRGHGDTFDDGSQGVAATASGAAFMTGYFRGIVDFGFGPLTGSGVQELFVVRIN